jgi:hypothetical protein
MRVQLMAAPNEKRSPGQALMLAALALPGLDAAAQTLPEYSEISVGYLYYKDEQPSLDRVSVRSPSLRLVVPVAGEWLLEGGAVSDHLSGATPRYHTALSGASRMEDKRNAGDVRVTRYFNNATLGVGHATSIENDYRSHAWSVSGTWSTEDRNTTAGLSLGVSNDRIDPVNLLVRNERRHATEAMFSLEQVLGKRDVMKADYTHVRGRGYYSDPYKLLDNRPRERDSDSLLLRWNHALERGPTFRSGYRYYRDSYGVRAHTLSLEIEHPLRHGWSWTPNLRYYTQSAADFYFDPVYDPRFGPPFPLGFVIGSTGFTSADQRLSGFGAVTAGLRVAKRFGQGWSAWLKGEKYRQRGSWRAFGSGSTGLERFDAQLWQLGVSKQW